MKLDKERIRAILDVEALYTSELGYPPAKKDSKSLTYLCPFHPDKNNPNLRINTESNKHRGGYRCFACGESGDVFDFVMKVRGVPFQEALEALAGRAGLPVNDKPIERAKTKEKGDAACKLNHDYESWPDDLKAWLVGRGIIPESIRAFNLAHALYQGR